MWAQAIQYHVPSNLQNTLGHRRSSREANLPDTRVFNRLTCRADSSNGPKVACTLIIRMTSSKPHLWADKEKCISKGEVDLRLNKVNILILLKARLR